MQKIRSQLRKSNICVEAEKPAGSRVLLAQHPRPSRFSAHDPCWAEFIKVNTGFINEKFEIDLRFKRMKLCIEGQLHAINCEKCEIIAIQAISTK